MRITRRVLHVPNHVEGLDTAPRRLSNGGTWVRVSLLGTCLVGGMEVVPQLMCGNPDGKRGPSPVLPPLLCSEWTEKPERVLPHSALS